jgi:hypothetical protein
MALPVSTTAFSRFLSSRRIQPADVTALATWGVAAGTAAFYLVQVGVELSINDDSYPFPNTAHTFVTWLCLFS